MKKTLHALWKHGPLEASRQSAKFMQKRLRWFPAGGRLFAAAERGICRFQQRLDYRQFDESHGTNTGGIIPLASLTISGGNLPECLWYEAVSPKTFAQFMQALDIPFGDYEFVDFGSGKGRVLLMAAEQGFRKATGVEFALELHQAALENVAIYNRQAAKPAAIEPLHQDAVNFAIPETPLVCFFYCPFRGKVLEQVLGNIVASHARNPRPIILLFNGQHPEVIAQFHATGFACREIKMKRDLTRFLHYRGLIFTSPAR